MTKKKITKIVLKYLYNFTRTTNSLIITNCQHWLNLIISNEIPYLPIVKTIKQSKLN